jgi:hypothetical protein
MVEIRYINEIDGIQTIHLDIEKFPYTDPCQYFKDIKLIRLVESGEIDVEKIFQHTEEKREILRERTNGFLKGQKGFGIPLSDCKESRIGKAFRDHYYAAKNKLNLHKEICNL